MMSPDDFYSQLGQIDESDDDSSEAIAAPTPTAAPTKGAPATPPTAKSGQIPVNPYLEEEAKAAAEYHSRFLNKIEPGYENIIKIQNKEKEQLAQKNADLDVSQMPGPLNFTEPRPDAKDFSVKTSPYLMMFTALAGKLGKISGLGMLKAQTGMLQGINSGNKQAYDEAVKSWKDHYDMATNEHQNMQQAWLNNMKARAGQYQAKELAAQDTLDMMGMEWKKFGSATSVINAYTTAQYRIGEAQAKLNAATQAADRAKQSHEDRIRGQNLIADRIDLAENKEINRDLRTYSDNIDSTQDFAFRTSSLKQSFDKLAAIVSKDPKIKTAIFVSGITDTDTLLKISSTNGTAAAQALNEYIAASNAIVGRQFAEMTKGQAARQAGLKTVSDKEIGALPTLKGKTLEQVGSAVNEMDKIAKEHESAAKQIYAREEYRLKKGGVGGLYRSQEGEPQVTRGTSGTTATKAPPPSVNDKGWTLHTDKDGNQAYVSPDGKQFEEVK